MGILKWFLSNGAFSVLIYLGFFMQIDGAKNLAIFLAWLTFVFSLFLFSKEAKPIIEKRINAKNHVPLFIDHVFDFLVAAIFIWFGCLFTGFFYLLHALIFISVVKFIKHQGRE